MNRHSAMRFILLLGLVSLFADVTYEGARGITGPFLALLGASGAVVGFVSGFGELVGYSLRLLSGYVSDRTRSYWSVTIIGYAMQLLAVPLLALTDQWQWAAGLLMMERLGKAIRVPPRDAMLSYASHEIGRGWGFGVHNAMDQIGAILGPLLLSFLLYYRYSYSFGFACLLVPALAALIILIFSSKMYPHPHHLEIPRSEVKTEGLNRSFWLYITGACLIAAGFIDYPLIAYHFQKQQIAQAAWIPLLYAIAMSVEGVSSLFLGKWFDRMGVIVLVCSTFCSAFMAPIAFFGGFKWTFPAMILWGIGMGGQESIMRAIIAHLVDSRHRAFAYGMFHLWFGISWFSGSFFMGALYDHSVLMLVLFSVCMQLASLPLLWFLSIRRSL